MSKLTAAQKKKIFAVAREIGIDGDLLHAMIEARFQTLHISDLTPAQAGALIDFMERQKGGPARSVEQNGKQVLMVTKRQLWKIEQMVKELGWEDNPHRLQGFVRKYAGTDNPNWMTKEQAWRLIESMKKVLSKEQKKAADAAE